MTTFERNDRAVLVVLDRIDEVLLREADGRVQRRDDALGDRDAEDLGRHARQREQAALREVVADGLEYSWPIPGERDLRGREFPGTPGNSHSRWEFPGVWEIRGEPGRGQPPRTQMSISNGTGAY